MLSILDVVISILLDAILSLTRYPSYLSLEYLRNVFQSIGQNWLEIYIINND